MIRMQAFIVISQNFDYAAFGYPPPSALFDHPLKFALHCLKAFDPALDLFKLPLRNVRRRFARLIGMAYKTQKCSDRVERKTKFPTMSDERQLFDMLGLVQPPVSSRTRRLWH